MRERHLAAALAAFSIFSAACKSETTDGVTMEGYVEEATEPGAFQPHPEAETGELEQVQVMLTEWAIELSRDTVPSGPVQFSIVNGGGSWHSFAIQGESVRSATEPLRPASGSTLVVELPPGTYRVYCPAEDDVNGLHVDLGMETRLFVR